LLNFAFEADNQKCTSIFLSVSKTETRLLLKKCKKLTRLLRKILGGVILIKLGKWENFKRQHSENRTLTPNMLGNVPNSSLPTIGEFRCTTDNTTKNENCTIFI